MSMWEPFTEPARRIIVRAQEVAQMFGSRSIGTHHLTFALGEGADDVGRLLAGAIDRDELRAQLGSASSAPVTEMVFTSGAKRAIELAFENARRLGHSYIGEAHLALGILGGIDRPPLIEGTDVDALCAALDEAGKTEETVIGRWKRGAGEDDPHPLAASILRLLQGYSNLTRAGTRVAVSIQLPGEDEKTWTYVREEKK